MPSELERLEEASARLAEVAGSRSRAVAERAKRMAERFRRRHFHVSVVGEFKRGKSTLINALLGREVLPTGVLPLTAVATEIAFGEPGATVVKLDGTCVPIGLGELPDYVTEARNPNNELGVARVEARVDSELLRDGLVIVDTPGIGSIYAHNDEVARQALLDADGAILVLSADEPLSGQERELLRTLAERRAPTFFLLNKVDHLSPAEVDQVQRFVDEAVSAALGRKERLWCTAALPALRERLRGEGAEPSSAEFGEFLEELSSFVREGLGSARLATGRRELAALAQELDTALTIEGSARLIDEETLAARVEEFRQASAREAQKFTDGMVLLARDVSELANAVGDRLRAFALTAPLYWAPELEKVARDAPTRHLEDKLRETVEGAVCSSFEEFRQAEADSVEEEWRRIAVGYRSEAEQRVNAVRAAAAELFDGPLPAVQVPAIAVEPERFFYLFLYVGSARESLNRAFDWVLPRRVVRRRLLAAAKRHLAEEFDKHSGRIRWDMAQRLDGARRAFELAMRDGLCRTVEAIIEASERAETLRKAAEIDRAHFLDEEERMREVISDALAFATTSADGKEAS